MEKAQIISRFTLVAATEGFIPLAWFA